MNADIISIQHPTNGLDELKNKFIPKCDVILLKIFPDDHPLSVEEQIFFIQITEGIYGYNEQIRNETLKLLSLDYNIRAIAPYLCIFIKEAIHTNIALTDLTLLIYSVRMTKSLLSNPHVNLKEHIHLLLPAILSCALSKRISKYYYDNHWTLRDFSAYVVAMICHIYSTKLNNLTKRVVNIYASALVDFNKPLTSIYGALKGLASLGEDVIKCHVFPHVHLLGRRLFLILERKTLLEDKQQILEAKNVREILLNIVSPVLFKINNVNDGGCIYINEFGYLGRMIYMQVKNIEKMQSEKKILAPFNNFIYFLGNGAAGLKNNYFGFPEALQKISLCQEQPIVIN